MLLVITINLFAHMHVPSYLRVLFCMKLYITLFVCDYAGLIIFNIMLLVFTINWFAINMHVPSYFTVLFCM